MRTRSQQVGGLLNASAFVFWVPTHFCYRYGLCLWRNLRSVSICIGLQWKLQARGGKSNKIPGSWNIDWWNILEVNKQVVFPRWGCFIICKLGGHCCTQPLSKLDSYARKGVFQHCINQGWVGVRLTLCSVTVSTYTLQVVRSSQNRNIKKRELDGGFKYFSCSPLFGEDSHFDEHIFQMGWFNHQLDKECWSC